VLFSRDDVVKFINDNFEPVWESVRPVPLVRIDFGNDVVLTRTLNGNIASYVCTPEGEVLDILPGIYTPAVYLDRLIQFSLLVRYVDQSGRALRTALLREYHQVQAKALVKNLAPLVLRKPQPVGKAAIENPLKLVLMPGKPTPAVKRAEKPRLASAEDLARWQALAEDTEINETARRLQIHHMLAGKGLVKPVAVTKRLYKEVLHADLDDPYLGLGEVLFATYPFQDKVH
jgi:hypothetical protein